MWKIFSFFSTISHSLISLDSAVQCSLGLAIHVSITLARALNMTFFQTGNISPWQQHSPKGVASPAAVLLITPEPLSELLWFRSSWASREYAKPNPRGPQCEQEGPKYSAFLCPCCERETYYIIWSVNSTKISKSYLEFREPYVSTGTVTNARSLLGLSVLASSGVWGCSFFLDFFFFSPSLTFSPLP